MKTTVTVTTTSVQTIELPKFFKSTHFQDVYFMLIDDRNYMRVFNREYYKAICDGPDISFNRVENIASWIEKGFEEITEDQFKTIFANALKSLDHIVNYHLE
jgi:hypothetical protein